ncbi:MAG: PucR family transcriptional regulator ligand-binding domain-containing protein [Proteobacteria bacterium]|nr:PucR family transcriptional regulator ligand-binding domain-containing protein [Pseudomonadota bacterium]
MTLAELADRLELRVLAGVRNLDRDVSGGYTSDLLSDVMANSEGGQIWITLQGHLNVVAVAVLRELAGVVIVGGRVPPEDMLARAEDEGLPVLSSERPAFELSGLIFHLLSD